jgi:hypothetical protein
MKTTVRVNLSLFYTGKREVLELLPDRPFSPEWAMILPNSGIDGNVIKSILGHSSTPLY